jgi:hypothetical protein
MIESNLPRNDIDFTKAALDKRKKLVKKAEEKIVKTLQSHLEFQIDT